MVRSVDVAFARPLRTALWVSSAVRDSVCAPPSQQTQRGRHAARARESELFDLLSARAPADVCETVGRARSARGPRRRYGQTLSGACPQSITSAAARGGAEQASSDQAPSGQPAPWMFVLQRGPQDEEAVVESAASSRTPSSADAGAARAEALRASRCGALKAGWLQRAPRAPPTPQPAQVRDVHSLDRSSERCVESSSSRTPCVGRAPRGGMGVRPQRGGGLGVSHTGHWLETLERSIAQASTLVAFDLDAPSAQEDGDRGAAPPGDATRPPARIGSLHSQGRPLHPVLKRQMGAAPACERGEGHPAESWLASEQPSPTSRAKENQALHADQTRRVLLPGDAGPPGADGKDADDADDCRFGTSATMAAELQRSASPEGVRAASLEVMLPRMPLGVLRGACGSPANSPWTSVADHSSSWDFGFADASPP